MNLYQRALDNLKKFTFNYDDLVPELKYGVAPPTYMSTDPRFDKRPNSQSTPASGRNSSMAPNPQAGETIRPHRGSQPQIEQEYTGRISNPEISPTYLDDTRVENVNIKGYDDYQSDPSKADPRKVRSAEFGYPIVPQTGYESAIDVEGNQGMYNRDVGEVNSPAVFGTNRAYQGSADQFSNSPIEDLGGSNYAPRSSQYFVHDELEDENAHPDQMWRQTHPNAVAHTVGHDHPFNHQHRYQTPVRLSRSVGNRDVEDNGQPI